MMGVQYSRCAPGGGLESSNSSSGLLSAASSRGDDDILTGGTPEAGERTKGTRWFEEEKAISGKRLTGFNE